MKNIVVAVVSSEKTYERLDNILFNDNFLNNRDKFDLAVVFNSEAKIEKKFKTDFDFIYYRENTGLDLGGFNYLIKNLGDYEYYFLLHDDSYYLYNNWVDYSIQLLKDNPEVDIIGNILFNALNKNEIKIFEKLIEQFKYNHLLQYSTINHLIHGVTGIFSHNAIDRLRKKYGSIPYINNKDKFLAMLCERLTTIMFIDCGIKYAQYPGDIYMYLAHSTENELNSYFSEGIKYYYHKNYDLAKLYYNKYISFAISNQQTHNIHLVYAILSKIYKDENNIEKAKYYKEKMIVSSPSEMISNELIKSMEL